MPNIYNAPNLEAVKHAFFGRKGGFSKPPYESLNFNIKSRDNPYNIKRNLDIAAAYYGMPGYRIVRLIQSHGALAVYVDKQSQYEITADGVVTDKKGLILGITTADCVPVLFADYKNGVIGAAHAGWRGALNGILESTLDLMLERGAELKNIAAAAGPCLQKQNFEVRDDMRDLFLAQSPENEVFFSPLDEGRYLCDLQAYVKHRLELKGVENISLSSIDTYSDEEHYFSYRRAVHKNEIAQHGDFGIELSTISL